MKYRQASLCTILIAATSVLATACGSEGQSEGQLGMSAQRSALAPQVPLEGAEIPKYVDPVPLFSGDRVDGTRPITVDMKEVQQRVLPGSVYARLGRPFDRGTFVWAYKVDHRRPHWPGYTIEAQRHVTTHVTYENHLQGPHGARPFLAQYLTVDQTIHWADPLVTTQENGCLKGPPYSPACLLPYQGAIPTTVHLHGAEDQSTSDGHPDTWWTAGFRYTGPSFTTNHFSYPNGQEATTLWFHDHTLGITRLNIFAGLAAFYLIRDERDSGRRNNPIGLPAESYEQELMIQDRQFDTNGQLIFPDGTPADNPTGLNGPPPNPEVHPFWIPEFFGDVITVNGKSWPYMRVEPRRYRFRLVNASNARFVTMQLIDQSTGASGPAIWQIGSDGGLFNTPVQLADPEVSDSLKLTLGIAERADVIIDFSGQKGKSFILNNTAPAPFPGGDLPDPDTNGQIMQFRVDLPLHGKDRSYNPAAPETELRAAPIVDLKPADSARPPDKVRQLVLVEIEGDGGPLIVLLNNSHWHGRIDQSDTPIPGSISNGGVDYSTENPQQGSTELWEIINLTEDAHPIHLHLIQYQEVNRQDFDVDSYRTDWNALFPGGTFNGVTYAPGEFIPEYGPPRLYNVPNEAGALGGNLDPSPYFTAEPAPVDPNEAGWKDTMRALPGKVSRIIARWAPQDIPVGGVVPGQNLYPIDPTVGPGYIWHCHILDHEDEEMMRPYLVVP
jgi:spore coat protein A